MMEWIVPALSGILGAALVVAAYVIGATLRRDHYLLAQVVQVLNQNAQRQAPPLPAEAPPGPRAVERPAKRDVTRD